MLVFKQIHPSGEKSDGRERESGVGRAFDFFADRADAFADFVNGVVHSGASALGGASGSGTTDKNNGGEESEECFHQGSLKHFFDREIKPLCRAGWRRGLGRPW